MSLPPPLDLDVYRRLHHDLRELRDEELIRHYRVHGQREGRTANAIAHRQAFASLVGQDVRALEIGPFVSPLLHGPQVRYCDVCSRDQLRARATALGLDAGNVPPIHFVLGDNGLDGICEPFDAVISSHCIEHQPDLVTHLHQVARILQRTAGRYFLLVPDKRYCFDHFIAESTIAEVLDAHEQRRTVHTLRSVIEHRALTTHNDAARHWNEANAPRPAVNPDAVRAAVNEWHNAKDAYIDVHAWYFTPESFAEIVEVLNHLGHSRLCLERLYPTRRGSNEFWAVLKASASHHSIRTSS